MDRVIIPAGTLTAGSTIHTHMEGRMLVERGFHVGLCADPRYPRPRGSARHRRATIRRRMQAQRRWWRVEGMQEARCLIMQGRGGGIFGTSVSASADCPPV